jgi:predicted phosphodiesterase
VNFLFLVISDSHGNIPALKAVLVWALGDGPAQGIKPAAALFLGDGAEDLSRAGAEAGFSLPWYKVRGNGDHSASLPESLVLSAGNGRRLFLSHGNHHGIESGYGRIAAAAQAAGAEAALFGHTHVPCLEYYGPQRLMLFNPGSIGRPRSRIGATFAVLEVPELRQEALKARFWGLNETRRGYTVQEISAAIPAGAHGVKR